MSESTNRGGGVPASEQRARATAEAMLEHELVPADVEGEVAALLAEDRPHQALAVALDWR